MLKGLAQTLELLGYACHHADFEAEQVALPLEHAARQLDVIVHVLAHATRPDNPREECS